MLAFSFIVVLVWPAGGWRGRPCLVRLPIVLGTLVVTPTLGCCLSNAPSPAPASNSRPPGTHHPPDTRPLPTPKPLQNPPTHHQKGALPEPPPPEALEPTIPLWQKGALPEPPNSRSGFRSAFRSARSPWQFRRRSSQTFCRSLVQKPACGQKSVGQPAWLRVKESSGVAWLTHTSQRKIKRDGHQFRRLFEVAVHVFRKNNIYICIYICR